MSEMIVGIDLGTTNSEIAVYRDGRPAVQADEAGRLILPSVVGLDQDGGLLVGEAARNQYILHPERTLRSIKRLMGSDRKVSLDGRDYRPQDISAMILRRLKEIAEIRLGQPVRKAVITVPAFFSDAQRQATREAGEIAGLEVARIVNEPTAAALVYEAAQQQGKRVLVYDLGGGTFDVSVVRVEEGVVEVIASHGNNHLGGDDFDHKIVERALDHLKIAHKADVSGDPRAMARIHRAAEAAKKHLSDHPFARIEEEYLAEVEGKPVHLAMELARTDYEEMIAPFIEETLSAIHIALKSADLTASQIEEVLLVGGATRTPLINSRLLEIFDRPARSEVDPDLCVAIGAAIQGAAIAGESVSAVLVDVTPYTFGTSALGMLGETVYPYCFVPIIPKNTPVPVRKSEAFRTVHDNQKKVEVRIYQGENEDALDNIQIGEFRVEDLADAPAGNIIILDLALDLDGILHVSAKEKATGLERRITIDKTMSRYDKKGIEEARQHIDRLFGDAVDEEGPAAGAQGSAPAADPKIEVLVGRARAKLDSAVADDRAEIVDLIEAIKYSRASGDASGLADVVRRLDDLLFYLET
jgi:molecular chaperone DnaK (HSP70)